MTRELHLSAIRKYVARKLVKLAHRVYPESPEVMDFYMRVMTDQLIYGGSVVRVNPTEVSDAQCVGKGRGR